MKLRLPKMFKPFLTITLLLTSFGLFAQNNTVSGVVTSGEDNSLLPGVNVLIKGTTTGTVTNINGKYELQAKEGDVLVFSFIGFITEEITVTASTNNYNLSLNPDLVGMEEVVVVGYGTQKKADLTSSIAVLSPKELIKMPGGITEGLQGSVAGVNVSRGRIRIRGVGSLGDTDPLWVVDGLIGGQAPNENEIESIQILKDAASCAIYGARGANGVIIVTTKKGKKGEPKVEYHAYGGTKYPWKTLDMMNATDFSSYVLEAYHNYNDQFNLSPGDADYQTPPPAYLDPYNPLAETNWQDEWFQRGYYQNHNLSISGGTESLTYRTGINFSENKNTVKRSASDNIQMFLNSTFKKGRLTVGQSFVISKNADEYGTGSYFDLLRTPSNLPIYDENEDLGYYITGTAETGNDMINQIAIKNLTDRKNEHLNLKGSIYAQYEIITGLNYKINIGIDNYRGYAYAYDKVYHLGKGINEEADLSETSRRSNRLMVENTLSYNKKIGNHSFTAMTGATSEQSYYRDMQAGGQGFLASSLRTLSNVLNEQKPAGAENSYNMFSVLGRINYDYLGRYLLTLNFRRDASSKFAPGNRWGSFPSASVGWRVSDEAFMEDLTWINNLKLRASYGQIGSQANMGNYDAQHFVETANQYYTLGVDQIDVAAPIPKQFGNIEAIWETSTMANLALDLALLEDKIAITAEYYNKKTTNLLVPVQIPTSSGTSEPPTMNAGELLNRGLEFSATVRNTHGDFSYSVTGNMAFNHNEMLSLGENDDPILDGEVSGGELITRTAVGSSIGRFWALKTDGIFKTQEEIDNYTAINPENGEVVLIQPNASPGDIKFRDLNNDGVINDNDKDWVGNPLPKMSYGINVNLDYKAFDFSMFWQGEYGQSIYNNGIGLYGHGTSAVNQTSNINDRFRAEDLTITTYDVDGNEIASVFYPANTDSDIPRAVMNDPNGNFNRASDYFVEDGSYLRLKRITLGYTLPEKLVSKYNVEKFRIYIGAKNLITITDYSNFDPEVAGLNNGDGYNLTRGIDMQQSWASGNLTTKEFFFGLQITF